MDSGGAFYIIVLKDFWHQSQGKPNGSVITNQNILYWIIWGEYSFTLVVLFVCLKKSNRNIFISGSSKLKFLIICQLTHSTTHADIYSVWINILDDAAGVLWNSFYGCFHSFYCRLSQENSASIAIKCSNLCISPIREGNIVFKKQWRTN